MVAVIGTTFLQKGRRSEVRGSFQQALSARPNSCFTSAVARPRDPSRRVDASHPSSRTGGSRHEPPRTARISSFRSTISACSQYPRGFASSGSHMLSGGPRSTPKMFTMPATSEVPLLCIPVMQQTSVGPRFTRFPPSTVIPEHDRWPQSTRPGMEDVARSFRVAIFRPMRRVTARTRRRQAAERSEVVSVMT